MSVTPPPLNLVSLLFRAVRSCVGGESQRQIRPRLSSGPTDCPVLKQVVLCAAMVRAAQQWPQRPVPTPKNALRLTPGRRLPPSYGPCDQQLMFPRSGQRLVHPQEGSQERYPQLPDKQKDRLRLERLEDGMKRCEDMLERLLLRLEAGRAAPLGDGGGGRGGGKVSEGGAAAEKKQQTLTARGGQLKRKDSAAPSDGVPEEENDEDEGAAATKPPGLSSLRRRAAGIADRSPSPPPRRRQR